MNSVKTILFLFIAIISSSCSNSDEKLTIALSKGSGGESYKNYSEWLSYHRENIQFVDLINSENPIKDLSHCDAILYTGGQDVHPGRFEKEDEADRCSIDLERDTLEFSTLEYALDNNLPILGICRGHQLINVALGGTLYTDIPSDLPEHSSHQVDEGDAKHDVILNKDTKLFEITNVERQVVNSNHHQGVENLANELKSSAKSPDGLNEAFEWKNPNGKSWLLAVGWHPERLNRDDKLASPIAKEFLKSAEIYKKERAKKK